MAMNVLTTAEKLRILKLLDVDAALTANHCGCGFNREGCLLSGRVNALAGIHKARVQQSMKMWISKHEREISINWLEEHGYSFSVKL